MSKTASENVDGIAYGRKKRELLQEAVNNYGLAVKYNPNLWQSYQNLAVIFIEDKQYETALEYMKKALKINPDNPKLQHNFELLNNRLRN
jgi:tetratricopeptide (TPR) repeat protein